MRKHGVRRPGVVSMVLVMLFSLSLVSQGVQATESELMPYEVLSGPAASESGGALPADLGIVVGAPDSSLDEVAMLLLAGRYGEALDRLELVGASDETAPRADYYKVLALCAVKRLSDAEGVVQAAAATSPYYALEHFALGCAYLNLTGRFDSSNPSKALLHFEAAAGHLPDAIGLRFYTGLALLELGRYEEAAVAMLEVANSSPGFADAHLNLGLALLRLGKVDEALEALIAASVMRPDDSQIYMALGDAFFSLGDFEDAADSYRSASVGPGGSLAAQYKMGLALLQSGDAAKAQATAADLVFPDHPKGTLTGHVVSRQGEDLASGIWTVLYRIEVCALASPRAFQTSGLYLASAYLAASDPDKASAYLEEAFGIYAGDAYAYLLLARTREMQGDIVAARAAAQKSVQIDPSNEAAWELYNRLK